jgi:hypothetical protein
MKKYILTFIVLMFLFNNAYALNLARVKTWSNGEILTHTDLNAEFDNILNHSIVNADVSASAAIVGSKLDLSVPGAIGGTTPAAGAFTTLSASSTLAVTGNATFNGSNTLGNGADTLTINSSSGITYTPAATWTFTAAQTVSGTWANLGTVTTADINGGTIDGVTIGGSSAPTTTNIGTVAAGTWQGTAIATGYGGTGVATDDRIIGAWVNFQGSSTINDSYNVDSVTDNGTGNYTITITTDFASANYVVAGNTADDSNAIRSVQIEAIAAGSLQVILRDTSANPADSNPVTIMMCGNR